MIFSLQGAILYITPHSEKGLTLKDHAIYILHLHQGAVGYNPAGTKFFEEIRAERVQNTIQCVEASFEELMKSY